MTPAQSLRAELQALADEIKAKHESKITPHVPYQGKVEPRGWYSGSAYSKCATCGDPWDRCCCGHRV